MILWLCCAAARRFLDLSAMYTVGLDVAPFNSVEDLDFNRILYQYSKVQKPLGKNWF